MYKDSIRNVLLKKTREEQLGNGYVSYAYKRINGTISCFVDSICYAGLMRASFPLTELCIYIHPIKESRKWQLDFVRWMLNVSPWALCFETKNAQEALDKGAYLRMDAQGVHVYAAIIAMRQFAEFAGFRNSYIKLREKGYSQTVSYITAQFLYTGTIPSYDDAGNEIRLERTTARSWAVSGHTVFCEDTNLQGMIKIITKKAGFEIVGGGTSMYQGIIGRVHNLALQAIPECGHYHSVFKLKDPKDLIELAKAVKKYIKKLN